MGGDKQTSRYIQFKRVATSYIAAVLPLENLLAISAFPFFSFYFLGKSRVLQIKKN
jgi:hypothetical protein